MMLSSAMLLRWLGERRDSGALTQASGAIERAVAYVLDDGVRTGDIGGNASTTDFTDAVLEVLNSGETSPPR